MNHDYQDIEQIVAYLNKKSDGVANVYAKTASMLESLSKDRSRLEQRVADLEARIERMIEKQSHYEAMAHAGGFEAGVESVTKANEPVGVVCEFEGILVGTLFEQLPDGTPLYTHPAKTLTDEEIADFTVRIYDCRTGAEAHEIVLAILKKASEK
jgi:hypothetical protein